MPKRSLTARSGAAAPGRARPLPLGGTRIAAVPPASSAASRSRRPRGSPPPLPSGESKEDRHLPAGSRYRPPNRRPLGQGQSPADEEGAGAGRGPPPASPGPSPTCAGTEPPPPPSTLPPWRPAPPPRLVLKQPITRRHHIRTRHSRLPPGLETASPPLSPLSGGGAGGRAEVQLHDASGAAQALKGPLPPGCSAHSREPRVQSSLGSSLPSGWTNRPSTHIQNGTRCRHFSKVDEKKNNHPVTGKILLLHVR